MSASLRALLAGIIDYAGLFPPAKLPLNAAIRNYARYRELPDAWLLGRFICPAVRLPELAPWQGLFRPGATCAFSALGRGGNSSTELLEGLAADLRDANAFRKQHEGRAIVDVLEVRLPGDIVPTESPGALAKLLSGLGTLGGTGSLFFEAPLTGDWRTWLPRLLRQLRSPGLFRSVGLKLRCGGLETEAFPTVEQVAFVLRACVDAGVPFKATAGLHHPLPRHDAELRTQMHGFVNVFAAGVFAYARQLDEAGLRAILEDGSPAHFAFDDAGLRWNNLCVTTAEIAAARRHAVLSFGSCSFDEPRDDLRALGWL